MRKGFLMVLAVALVAVLAAPAVAGTDINGFYRAKAYVSNFKTGSATAPSFTAVTNDNGALGSASYVEQRIRIRFAFGEENVKAIWFSEIDFGQWGDSAGNAPAGSTTGGAIRNTGGAFGGDKINLETKNVYLWFKVPDTSLDVAVGLQTQTDNFQGLLYGAADMAGIFATGKYEPISWKLGWAKWYENSTLNWDDSTLYMGLLNWAPSKDVKLGFSVYFMQDDTQKSRSSSQLPDQGLAMFNNNGTARLDWQPALPGFYTIQAWTPGIDFAWNAGAVQLSGFGLYQFGTMKGVPGTATGTAPGIASGGNPKDIDISGFALDLRVDATLGPGKFFIEGLWISGGDGTSDKYGSILTSSDLSASPNGNSAFNRMDFSILMGNPDDINTAQCIIGCAAAVVSQSPGNSGRGMGALGMGYSMKASEKTSLKIGAGYLQATELFKVSPVPFNGTLTNSDANRKKGMGTEVNANVNYNIMKGLDFGAYAAYAWLNDFLNTNFVKKLDDAYDLHLRLNYAF